MTYYGGLLTHGGVLLFPKGFINMPRKSPYRVLLTDEERRSLREMAARYTSPYCDVVRAKVVLLAAEGLDNQEIAHRLDLPRQIISKWRKRFCQERLAGLEDRPRRGRPGSFSP
jgi:transposase-like protein